MKLARIGAIGQEKPAIIEGDEAIFVDSIISDWNRATLTDGAIATVTKADLSNLPRVSTHGLRFGAPISQPTKLICVGLNYLAHIKEAGFDTPVEPVIFMKAPDSLTGPNEDVVIPPNSQATDYEVELAIVIGKRALYLDSPADSAEHILGYSISQDVSERHWQMERAGQWVKGKSFPTFNPLGPVIVTGDSINAHNLRLWCSLNGEMKQDSNTDDLLYGIDHIVWYISQFMELFPGDVINTGTPFGVGMGFKPPIYLKAGDVLKTGIEGIGEITNHVVAYSKGSK
jgi:2-keto-4-pentenoate hydratase/2-oxohepta-3-ene-1,7-dioic acid hydratase in catechol pathway